MAELAGRLSSTVEFYFICLLPFHHWHAPCILVVAKRIKYMCLRSDKESFQSLIPIMMRECAEICAYY